MELHQRFEHISPTVVAMQWTGGNLESFKLFAGDLLYQTGPCGLLIMVDALPNMVIDDWLVRGVNDNTWVLSDECFQKQFKLALPQSLPQSS